MIGLLDNNKPIIRVFANINPEDKAQMEKDVIKMVSQKSCQEILGADYQGKLQQQQQLFNEIKNLPDNP